MLEILQYTFMQRAFLAGGVLALVLAMLGVFVVLKKMSFFAQGISHASLAGVAAGLFFSFSPLGVALFAGAFFALLIYFLEEKYDLSSDTAIGVLFTAGMSLGVIMISITPGYQPELFSFLFGSILSISSSDLWITLAMAVVIIGFWFMNLRALTLMSLDEDIAYIYGVNLKILKPALYVILAIAVVLGVKILGVLLVSSLLILPVATAKSFACCFKRLLIYSVIIAEIMVLFGTYWSYVFDLPTGPTIVLWGTLMLSLSLLKKK